MSRARHNADANAAPTSPARDGKDSSFETLRELARIQNLEVSDEIAIATRPRGPGALSARRSAAARRRSPERLHLDRRQLGSCPVLEGEDKLRLLNYQNNSIARIENLEGLPNLAFLDLYDNKVRQIENLEACKNLRVLMLGKNQIQCIESLDGLQKLDVLDLHSNRIGEIQNLGHLKDLRVLNLAGNSIQALCNLEGLKSLTEFNVRRNALTSTAGIAAVPQLERLFASHNGITTHQGLEALGTLAKLRELALDGNPICDAAEAYRAHVFSVCKGLEVLDGKDIPVEIQEGLKDALPPRGITSFVISPSPGVAPGPGPQKASQAAAANVDASPPADVKQAADASAAKDTKAPTSELPSLPASSAVPEKLESSEAAVPPPSPTVDATAPAEESTCMSRPSLPAIPVASAASASEPLTATAAQPMESDSTQLPSSVPCAIATGEINAGRPVTNQAVKPASAGCRPSSAGLPAAAIAAPVGARTAASKQPSAAVRSQPHLKPQAAGQTLSASGVFARQTSGSQPGKDGKLARDSSGALTGKKSSGKALTSAEVMEAIQVQWTDLVLHGHASVTRHGYVRRERATELSIYGRGLDALDKVDYQNVVTSLQFHYITIEVLVSEMARLLKFKELSCLTLTRNQIMKPSDLAPLRRLPRLRRLVLEENPICQGRANLRVSLLRYLPYLNDINGRAVDDMERVAACNLHASTGEDGNKGQRRPSKLIKRDTSTADPLSDMVNGLLSHARGVDDKIRAVHEHFEDVVRDVIREAWDDVLALEQTEGQEGRLLQLSTEVTMSPD